MHPRRPVGLRFLKVQHQWYEVPTAVLETIMFVVMGSRPDASSSSWMAVPGNTCCMTVPWGCRGCQKVQPACLHALGSSCAALKAAQRCSSRPISHIFWSIAKDLLLTSGQCIASSCETRPAKPRSHQQYRQQQQPASSPP